MINHSSMDIINVIIHQWDMINVIINDSFAINRYN